MSCLEPDRRGCGDGLSFGDNRHHSGRGKNGQEEVYGCEEEACKQGCQQAGDSMAVSWALYVSVGSRIAATYLASSMIGSAEVLKRLTGALPALRLAHHREDVPGSFPAG